MKIISITLILFFATQFFALDATVASSHIIQCYDSKNKPVFRNVVDEFGNHKVIVLKYYDKKYEEIFYPCFYSMDGKTVLAGSQYQQIEIVYNSNSMKNSGEYRIGSCINGATCGCIFGITHHDIFTCN